MEVYLGARRGDAFTTRTHPLDYVSHRGEVPLNSSTRATVVDAADREPPHLRPTHWEAAKPPAMQVARQRFQYVPITRIEPLVWIFDGAAVRTRCRGADRLARCSLVERRRNVVLCALHIGQIDGRVVINRPVVN